MVEAAIPKRLEGIIPERSAEDIFAGRVRLTFAGQTYDLPTLVIEAEEKWLANIDGQMGGLLSGLSTTGDDYSAMLGLLSGAGDKLLTLLYDYDQTHVLPERDELRKVARSHELIRAVLEVWVAANPLVGISLVGLSQMNAPTNGHSPAPTSLPRPTTAGRRARSARR